MTYQIVLTRLNDQVVFVSETTEDYEQAHRTYTLLKAEFIDTPDENGFVYALSCVSTITHE